MSEETTGSQEAATQKKSFFSFKKIIIAIILIAGIAVAVYFYMNSAVAVAVVNGQKITKSEYDERYAALAAGIVAGGQSATTTEMMTQIKTQTIDNLVTEALLLQAAAKEGVKSDSTAVDTQFSSSKSQFADDSAFTKALTDGGYTADTFKSYLTRANIIQQYLTSHIDVNTAAASNAEVTSLYEQVAAVDKTVPPLSEIKSQVEAEIVRQKQQMLVTDYISKLRASSTIEILLK
ncbi:MAG: hypothetical protein A3H57_01910 [Candidatus Taylorbacteria bacterium RIFCSPLOWO2_02_FULL_43_11]|uniref:PpiC domain-containing protein n=1 Tax=Candidatus Taylorbacteria bacterium RIFCSPHIGHO2_02_FULL_43_32b TaxID=1802306 RepID=A0A1G2MI02_9BACT|nr:MAG: hypothetical protein A2743_04500 [Candidatus Taylorbacteria bacterium RIFCSPHIGHO2_01_FULL_43_47]OHA22622.1 MAG: hypothetical protein A3C72_03070 [Candidatus Taylorbacteria bacterium RIFCSPHIGHO2_02_FULL_43_32b]OHA29582.1 MAG: hypothetical protein A3B08_02315 [Candidatus Taylorbacteria bacterium RIFCSPLOWO2_01_FULL_43_44]OHA36311.1 MAG: hypothetical protein A3H57_01910 [Candidatus Taylorbacteria bacterium RIFCSPLOWO2_02_FULL_43_11]